MEFHELHPLKELIYTDKHITLLFDKENYTVSFCVCSYGRCYKLIDKDRFWFEQNFKDYIRFKRIYIDATPALTAYFEYKKTLPKPKPKPNKGRYHFLDY